MSWLKPMLRVHRLMLANDCLSHIAVLDLFLGRQAADYAFG
jgi:hypothetical protein